MARSLFNASVKGRQLVPVSVAAAALSTFFVVSFSVQLKPFFWDTYDVSSSLQEFDSNRYILMTGMWVRAFVLIPATLLGVSLYELLEKHGPFVARSAGLFIFAYGLLSAVSGWVGVVVGVPAEEFEPGALDAHALQVLADSLYWVQDNLITMANITLGVAVFAFSLLMRRHGYRRWETAGFAVLPFALLAASSFYFQVGILFGLNIEAPVYLAGMTGLSLALVVWTWAIARRFGIVSKAS